MAKKKPVTVRLQDGVPVIALKRMDIWDGADLCLLRTTLDHLIHLKQYRKVAIDMQQVKYIEGGFFGMLCDGHDIGVSIRLLAPEPQVKRMIWFRQFFAEVAEGIHCFLSEPRQILSTEHRSGTYSTSDSTCEPKAKPITVTDSRQQQNLYLNGRTDDGHANCTETNHDRLEKTLAGS